MVETHRTRPAAGILLFAVALLLCAGLGVWAQDAVEFVAGEGHISVVDHMRWTIDENGSMTPEMAAEALVDAERPTVNGEWIELGFMQAVAWMSVVIHNNSQEDTFILEFRNPRMSYVDCYVPNAEGGYDLMQNGSMRPFDVRPVNYTFPAFPVNCAPGETKTILLRLENIGDWRSRVWLWETDTYYNHIATAHDPSKISIGALGVLAIINLLIWVSLRERAYLYLSFFIMSWLFFLMSNTGIGKWLLWNDFPWLTARASSIFAIFMCASFLIFSMAYLDSHKTTPKLYRLGQYLGALTLVIFLYNCFFDNLFRMHVNRILGVVTFAFVTLLVVQAIRKGNRQARFFLFSWLLVLAASAMIVLLSLYVVSAQWIIGTSFINVMFSTSILLWSFELTGRVKERAAQQRRMLREQVKERTKELEAALADVKTLSGLLPICSHCKKIRDDDGYWGTVEGYIKERTDADFTHGICPDCLDEHFGGLGKRKLQEEAQGDSA